MDIVTMCRYAAITASLGLSIAALGINRLSENVHPSVQSVEYCEFDRAVRSGNQEIRFTDNEIESSVGKAKLAGEVFVALGILTCASLLITLVSIACSERSFGFMSFVWMLSAFSCFGSFIGWVTITDEMCHGITMALGPSITIMISNFCPLLAKFPMINLES